MTNTGPYEPCFVPVNQKWTNARPYEPLSHHVVAPAEAWEDAPADEPRFRVVLIPHAEHEKMQEATVPKRSVASVLEDFTRLDPYTVIVERVTL